MEALRQERVTWRHCGRSVLRGGTAAGACYMEALRQGRVMWRHPEYPIVIQHLSSEHFHRRSLSSWIFSTHLAEVCVIALPAALRRVLGENR